MGRWLVRLEGERFDVEEFPRAFPDGPVSAVEIEGMIYLTGCAFDLLTDAGSVREEAKRRLSVMAGALKLTQPNLHAPSVGSVIRERDDGKRDIVFFPDTAMLRVKEHAVVVSLEGPGPFQPRQTSSQQATAEASASPHLEEALSLWSEVHSWPRLYRILEAVEHYLGRDVDDAGLCSDSERERFKRTANSAEAAGVDARHAAGSFQPPKKPMSLDEGRQFINSILRKALKV